MSCFRITTAIICLKLNWLSYLNSSYSLLAVTQKMLIIFIWNCGVLMQSIDHGKKLFFEISNYVRPSNKKIMKFKVRRLYIIVNASNKTFQFVGPIKFHFNININTLIYNYLSKTSSTYWTKRNHYFHTALIGLDAGQFFLINWQHYPTWHCQMPFP